MCKEYEKNNTIGKNIKIIRAKKRISQKELADRLNTTPQNISQYESGKRNPRMETLERFADALEVSVRDLVENTDGFCLIDDVAHYESDGVVYKFRKRGTNNWQDVFEKIDKKLKEMPYRSQILIRTNYKSSNFGFENGTKYFLNVTYEKGFARDPDYETISIFKCYTNDLYKSLSEAYEELILLEEKLKEKDT